MVVLINSYAPSDQSCGHLYVADTCARSSKKFVSHPNQTFPTSDAKSAISIRRDKSPLDTIYHLRVISIVEQRKIEKYSHDKLSMSLFYLLNSLYSPQNPMEMRSNGTYQKVRNRSSSLSLQTSIIHVPG